MAEVGMQNLGQIEKLIGRENYGTWKFAMRACLEAEDLWGCILGEEAYLMDTKKMTKARAKIVLAVQKQNYGHIQSAETPRQAWENLRNAFEDKGLTRKVGLLRTLTSTKLLDCNSVEEYVNTITTTAHTLKELEFEVKEEMIGALLLSGLPDEYKPMIMGLESSGTIVTADAIKVKLLQEVKYDGKQTGEAALYSKARATRKKGQERTKSRCYACGKIGHFAAKCRNKMKDETKEKDGSTHRVFATFANRASAKSDEWYLDSGASTHMTGWADCLKETKKCNKTITAANHGQLKAVARGTAELEVAVNGTEKIIRVENVLYVPGLAANLLSVDTIVQRDYKVNITKNGCTIHDAEGDLVAVAKPHGGVYRLCKVPETAFATIETEQRGGVWHRRMGHLGRGGMKQLTKGPAKSIRGFETTKEECDICVKGKQSRKPFKFSGKRARVPLELIHSDICGPMSTESLGGAKYFITFIEDYSRKKFVYFLKHKSEAVKAFKNFRAYAENKLERKIKSIRTDNGREYVNKEFKDLLQSLGIAHQTTVPYNPQQNGLAERANRSIVERARCMLIDANLPKGYWAEATSTAVYLLNRSPASALRGRTPEELWSGREPNIKHLRVFGSKALAYVPREKRDKWDSKAQELIFIGYNENTKGYRLIDPRTKKITVSRDVVFREGHYNEVSGKNKRTQEAAIYQLTEELQEEHEQAENFDSDSSEEENDESENQEDVFLEADGNIEEAQEPAQEERADQPGEHRIQQNEAAPRRSERKWKPINRPGYMAYMASEEYTVDPSTVEEAMASSERQNWMRAMQDEIHSLQKNNTWDVVDQPPRIKPLAAKWVFKKKLTETGETRYKARLVAKGCAQIEGRDYSEVFSPVIRYETIRYLLATAAKNGWTISHMDVVTAYLNSELKEEIYITPPKGILKTENEKKVWKLKRAMYGLKQSGRAWNDTIDKKLKEYGMRRLNAYPCVYMKKEQDKILIVAVYVDDLLILGNHNGEQKRLKKFLNQFFEMKDLGEAKYFLGLEIHQNKLKGEIKITQENYITRTLKKFGMEDCKPIGTPADPNVKLTESDEERNEPADDDFRTQYLEAIGSLLYISQISRPDIAQSVNAVSSFCKDPKKIHWTAVKRIFRYLKNTANYHLKYSKNNDSDIIGYSDADWGNDKRDRKSISGCVFMLNGGAIIWHSKKQRTVALSTVEAEYIALAFTCQEAIWLRNLSHEITEIAKETLEIKCDNNGAINLSKNNCNHQRTKHIDIRHHFVREILTQKHVNITHIPSDEMTADILTKPLPKPQHVKLASRLGLNSA